MSLSSNNKNFHYPTYTYLPSPIRKPQRSQSYPEPIPHFNHIHISSLPFPYQILPLTYSIPPYPIPYLAKPYFAQKYPNTLNSTLSLQFLTKFCIFPKYETLSSQIHTQAPFSPRESHSKFQNFSKNTVKQEIRNIKL